MRAEGADTRELSDDLPMTRKPQKKRPEKDPEQYKRFLEAARDAGASDSPKDLERAVKKLARAKP
jgi:hypothetical protein